MFPFLGPSRGIVVVHLPGDEEDTNMLDCFEESTVGEEEVPHLTQQWRSWLPEVQR